MLEINYSKEAVKFLKKLNKSDKKLAKQIVSKIVELQANTKIASSIELINYSPFRRIRVGKYRIIYKYDEQYVYIVVINKREIVYKNLNKLFDNQ
jgi:mRNA interferase RelE/StbE